MAWNLAGGILPTLCVELHLVWTWLEFARFLISKSLKLGKTARSATKILCPGLYSTITGPNITIPKPLESSQALGVHWLCQFGPISKCPKLGKTARSVAKFLCLGLHSTTTCLIITIQTPLECSRAAGVHWLCHSPDYWFWNARNWAKLPDRPSKFFVEAYTRQLLARLSLFKNHLKAFRR